MGFISILKIHRQGKNSAKGYYESSYDGIGFVANLFKARQLGSPVYAPATHNLVTDGAYLFKPNYRSH